jgi:hypothetical protein
MAAIAVMRQIDLAALLRDAGEIGVGIFQLASRRADRSVEGVVAGSAAISPLISASKINPTTLDEMIFGTTLILLGSGPSGSAARGALSECTLLPCRDPATASS